MQAAQGAQASRGAQAARWAQAETTGEDQGVPKPCRGATPGGIPEVGAAALQARVPSHPISSACSWGDFQGGWGPGSKAATPPAAALTLTALGEQQQAVLCCQSSLC